MPNITTSASSSQRPFLRLWPGVIALSLLFFSRFGVKSLLPGFEGFKTAMLASFSFGIIFILWWLLFSRAAWLERVAGLLMMAGAMVLTVQISHESMSFNWLFGYGIPFLFLAFTIAAVASRRKAAVPRRAVMAAAILLATLPWALIRSEGINGDHDSSFAWRFSATTEDLIAQQQPGEPISTLASYQSDSSRTVFDRPASAWPGFRGPQRDGVVAGVKIAADWSHTPPAELWRRSVGPGWSSIAVTGDLIYTQEQRGKEEIVSSYRLKTGEPVWQHRDAVRFFESNAGAGPRATPALANGRVFALGATGILNALDAGDGSLLWSRDVVADSDRQVPQWGFSGSPLVVGDTVFVAASGQLVAYDALRGEKRWIGPSGGGYSSPQLLTVNGTAQILLMSGHGTTALAPLDGQELWQHEWGGFPMTQPALISGGDLLISAQESGGIRRLAVRQEDVGWKAEEQWTSLSLKPYFNDFVVHEGHVYGFDGRILAAVELERGERQWKGGRYGSGQMILLPDSDALLVLSEKGELALVRATPEKFEELARYSALKGKTWNHPTLVGDVLLVRNSEEMAAFRLPLAN